MAGYKVDADSLNQRVGHVVETVRDYFDEIVALKAFVDRYPTDAALVAAVSGLSQADATAIRGGLTDLSNMVATARGQRAQSPASDFFFNAKFLLGIQ